LRLDDRESELRLCDRFQKDSFELLSQLAAADAAKRRDKD